MITDYVPGAYMTHDMLHMRGGHQTSWLIDGVAIPNTKIASNVGPQIDPKDIDSAGNPARQLRLRRGRPHLRRLQRPSPQRIRVQPRRRALPLPAATSTPAKRSFRSATTPPKPPGTPASPAPAPTTASPRPSPTSTTTPPTRRAASSRSFATRPPRISSASTPNTARTTSRFPTTPIPNDYECASGYYCSYGLRDGQTERDSFVIANWVHTLSPRALFSFAPFYHFNQANYDSLSTDHPVATTWHQTSNYVGGQADAHLDAGPNSFSAGLYSFYQEENDLFGVLDQRRLRGTS